MGSTLGKLTVLSVKNAKSGRHVDGDGLCLVVKPSGAKSWVLRVQVGGKRRDIGLGSTLSLQEAREKAAGLRKAAKAGHDPVLERDKDKRAPPIFRDAVITCHAELSKGWTTRSAAAFLSSLNEHAVPRVRTH